MAKERLLTALNEEEPMKQNEKNFDDVRIKRLENFLTN